MSELLTIDSVDTYYGDFQALFDVSADIEEGEILGVVGRNGAGKTTLFRSIMGLSPPASGSIDLGGTDITKKNPESTYDMGVGYVPGDRQVFPNLTVKENLVTGMDWGQSFSEDLVIFELFPRLLERLNQNAGTMSGGEQQMLAIARALISDPDLLLLDEPIEGLAPTVVSDLEEAIYEINKNTTIAVIEHDIDLVLEMSDRLMVINRGEVHYQRSTIEIQNNPQILEDALTI